MRELSVIRYPLSVNGYWGDRGSSYWLCVIGYVLTVTRKSSNTRLPTIGQAGQTGLAGFIQLMQYHFEIGANLPKSDLSYLKHDEADKEHAHHQVHSRRHV